MEALQGHSPITSLLFESNFHLSHVHDRTNSWWQIANPASSQAHGECFSEWRAPNDTPAFYKRTVVAKFMTLLAAIHPIDILSKHLGRC
jgi:hypothetical protein